VRINDGCIQTLALEVLYEKWTAEL
jgi:hypothetical protein